MVGNSFFGLPSRSRLLIYAAVVLLCVLGYLVWSPGTVLTDGRHDLRHNAIWMSHAYLADDRWFARNGKTDLLSLHRDPVHLWQTADLFRRHHITDLFPHLCPAEPDGRLPSMDDGQAERFLDAFPAPDFRVLPWVGGVSTGTARIDSSAWRTAFAQSCREVLIHHSRFAGVHLNIEPCPSGNPDFLALLVELRAPLPPGKLLSVAAYPPPTVLHRFADVHWDQAYYGQVACRCDQMVVMLYDTGLHNRRLYQNLLRSWTSQVLPWSAPTPVLLGVAAYDDAGAGYHDPAIENVAVSLPAIHSGLLAWASLPPNYQGVALYSHWTMTETKWESFRRNFLAGGVQAH